MKHFLISVLVYKVDYMGKVEIIFIAKNLRDPESAT